MKTNRLVVGRILASTCKLEQIPIQHKEYVLRSGKHRRSDIQICIWILASLLPGCVTLGKITCALQNTFPNIFNVFQVDLRIRGHGHVAYNLVCKRAHTKNGHHDFFFLMLDYSSVTLATWDNQSWEAHGPNKWKRQIENKPSDP